METAQQESTAPMAMRVCCAMLRGTTPQMQSVVLLVELASGRVHSAQTARRARVDEPVLKGFVSCVQMEQRQTPTGSPAPRAQTAAVESAAPVTSLATPDRSRTRIGPAASSALLADSHHVAMNAGSAWLRTSWRTASRRAKRAVRVRRRTPTGPPATCALVVGSRRLESSARSVHRRAWWRRQRASATHVRRVRARTPTGPAV